MKKLKTLLAAGLMLFSASLKADCNDHYNYKTNNYMIPVGRLVFNPEIEDSNIAFSALGEIGVRNYRANLTVGTWTTERSRIKASGEFLTQKLRWNTATSRADRWVEQGAGGIDWQYLLDDCSFLQAFDVKGYYSYSDSKNLSTETCTDGPGAPVFTFQRHLAGANAMGGSLTGVMVLGDNHRLDLSLDYDHVRYRKRFDHDKKVMGWGGSFMWITRLPCCMDFALEGQFRRPFNYFGARLTWPRTLGSANTTVSVFGGWVRGKYSLPNSLKAGVELVYNFKMGSGCCEAVANNCEPTCLPLWNPCDLNAWVVVPAVYMPEVLAIAESLSSCAPVGIATNLITIQPFLAGLPFESTVAQTAFVSALPLTYSAVNLPTGFSIDPVTGIISGISFDINPSTATVTATNGCASASVDITFDPILPG